MIANVFRAFLAQKLEAGGSETTIYLDRITTLTGETITTSDFADFSRGIITVNPDGDGVSSFPEYISFTAVSGLTLTGASRGLSAKSNSTVSANKRFHPADTPVILSFGSHNIQDILDYVDAQVAALTLGANVVSTGTAGEDLTIGQGVYLKNDGKWWKWDADTAATLEGVVLGICQSTTTANNTITSGVLLKGLDVNQSGLSAGTEYFASNTAGGIASSAGTTSKKIGVARSTTNLYFDPYYGNLLTALQAAALAGGSSFGTPSSTNKFLTEEYLSAYFAARPPQVVTFTASGTWTKDAGLKYIIVEGVGGGGGADTDDEGAGSGGGYFRKLILAASLGATETVTIGAAGASATASGSRTNGGNTSFGSHCTGNGGAKDGGAGGTATGGDINIAGQVGAGGSTGTGGNYSSGGGSMLGLGGHGSTGGTGYGVGGNDDQPATAGIVIVTEYY